MTGDRDAERIRVARSFDAVADVYRRQFADELDHKPSDRALLGRMARLVPASRPVLEVGAGPGHVGAALAGLGPAVIVSDASPGQLHQARCHDPRRPLVLADLGLLPVGVASLGGILAFYCLIYGPAHHCDAVFADWARALVPGGVVAITVHAGHGAVHADDWQGRPVDLTVVLRDPDDLSARLGAHGFDVVEQSVRRPYPGEHPTDRCSIVATLGRRGSMGGHGG